MGTARSCRRPRGAISSRRLSGGRGELCEIYENLIAGPDQERADRDHMAVGVALGAIAERLVDRILFRSCLQSESRMPRRSDRDGIPAGGGSGELARDVVAAIRCNGGAAG